MSSCKHLTGVTVLTFRSGLEGKAKGKETIQEKEKERKAGVYKFSKNRGVTPKF
jgi:hypothetical protein